MKKPMSQFLLFSLFTSFVFATDMDPTQRAACFKGNRSVCDKLLDGLNTPEDDHQFRYFYDELCRANKKFKCFKLMVRGDYSEELEQLKKEEPNASFHIVKSEAEVTIFRIAEDKSRKSGPAKVHMGTGAGPRAGAVKKEPAKVPAPDAVPTPEVAPESPNPE